jgi:hypothetical protein
MTNRADFCPAGMHKPPLGRCMELIEKTANALSDVVAFMLLAAQKDNLGPNIKQAIEW